LTFYVAACAAPGKCPSFIHPLPHYPLTSDQTGVGSFQQCVVGAQCWLADDLLVYV